MWSSFHMDSVWEFDSTISHQTESFAWRIHSPSPIEPWQNLIYVFPTQIWLLLFFTIIISNCLWIFLEYHQQQNLDITNLLLQLTGTLLQNSQPLRDHSHNRMLLMLWAWFGLIITTVFSARFYNLLTVDLYDKPIESLEEAVRIGGLQFAFSNNTDTSIHGYDSQLEERIFKNRINCESSKYCFDLLTDTNVASCVVSGFAESLIPHQYLDSITGRKLVYRLKSELVVFHLNLIMVKGFPLLEAANSLIARMKQSGLIDKWDADYRRETFKVIVRKRRRGQFDRSIRLEHVFIPFMLFLVGCFFGIVVFICEISFHVILRKYK